LIIGCIVDSVGGFLFRGRRHSCGICFYWLGRRAGSFLLQPGRSDGLDDGRLPTRRLTWSSRVCGFPVRSRFGLC